ncbi:uncharacterized protein A1O5_01735 [Cladophialophora psammophila CBS 110553]|uniref:Transcription factor domain-containing protein n=1 Tax=Cladophialophora psammophila CBS 110553 TaxID=1182543 RepID=W9XXP7_9EURO|nr:uncharacterized protein A1O5_01735 [Cladophialophora psammophila CBS 110553]EXJ75039.1 hypothetical protein A1O5_01735 [Cladophialophora psammophila CBS 110553]
MTAREEADPDLLPFSSHSQGARRIKALEEKVNDLLTLLTPDKNVLGDTNVTAIATTSAPLEQVNSDNVSFASTTNVHSTKTCAPPTADENRQFDVIDSGVLTMATANALLKKYQQVHSQFFPFVIVAPEIDAATLRRDASVLFLAITTACLEEDHAVQRRLGVELKRMLCERILIRNERNIELLQALLVHLSWIHYHFHPMNNKQSYMLLQMAIGLVMDLDLDRCPAHRDQRKRSCQHNARGRRLKLAPFWVAFTFALRKYNSMYGLDEAGLTKSSMAMTRKELVMRHTEWIEHCCHVLRAAQETATDVYAIAFVGAKRLAQQITERFSYGDHTFIRFQSDAVIQMSLNGFKKEIAELGASFAFSAAQENYVLMAELRALPVIMHEVALYRDPAIALQSTITTSHLWELLTSTRAFLDYFLSVPTDALRHLPAAFFSFSAYALIVLSMIARLPSTSGWDSSMAKHEADVLNIAQRVKIKVGDELTRAGHSVSTEQKDVWAFFGRGMGGLMAWHERCEKESEGTVAATGGGERDYELPISESGAPLTTRCAVADMMTPFNALRFRKHVHPSTGGGVPNGPQGENPNAASGGTAFIGGGVGGGADTQPTDMGTSFWDDEVWQSIMDEFSMFPTSAGFPTGPSVQHQVERLRW